MFPKWHGNLLLRRVQENAGGLSQEHGKSTVREVQGGAGFQRRRL